MDVIWGILAVVWSLLLVVGLHEAGHAIAAYWLGVRIKSITIGFGKPLWAWQFRGVEWVWALWPLGGSVDLLNTRIATVSPDLYTRCFDKKAIWVRIVILLSGVVANLITAWLAFVLIAMLGYKQLPPILATVTPASIAANAQLTPGDTVLAVAGHATTSWQKVGMQFIAHLGEKNIPLIIKHNNGALFSTSLDLSRWQYHAKETSLLTSMGITPNTSASNIQYVEGISLWSASQQAGLQICEIFNFFISMLQKLLTGTLPFMLLLGPIGFFSAMMDSFFQGLVVFLSFIAHLSVSMIVINLLPIPGLDGGSIVYALIEKIRGKPVSTAFEVLLHRLIFIALSLVFIQLLLNDLHRYLGK